MINIVVVKVVVVNVVVVVSVVVNGKVVTTSVVNSSVVNISVVICRVVSRLSPSSTKTEMRKHEKNVDLMDNFGVYFQKNNFKHF